MKMMIFTDTVSTKVFFSSFYCNTMHITTEELKQLETNLSQNADWISLSSEAKAHAMLEINKDLAYDICHEEAKKLKKPAKSRAPRKPKVASE